MAQDAIALLETDHTRVEELFREFKSAGNDRTAKFQMAQVICSELTLHTMIEEEIFYPAFAQATGEQQVVDHALKDHREVKDFIARVPNEQGNLDGLMEAIRQHVTDHVEEERRDVFPKARACGMELATLGGRMQTRRDEIVTEVHDA